MGESGTGTSGAPFGGGGGGGGGDGGGGSGSGSGNRGDGGNTAWTGASSSTPGGGKGTPDDEDSPSEDELNLSVVGGTAGGAVFLCAAVALLFRKRQRSRRREDGEPKPASASKAAAVVDARTMAKKHRTMDASEWAAQHEALHPSEPGDSDDVAMRENPLFLANRKQAHLKAKINALGAITSHKGKKKRAGKKTMDYPDVSLVDEEKRRSLKKKKARRLSKGQQMLMKRMAQTKARDGGGATLPKTHSDLSVVASVALVKPKTLHHAKTVTRLTRKSSFGRLQQTATACADYSATGDDQVSMTEGDEVQVMRTHHSQGWEGWSTVKHVASGKSGLVPSSYLFKGDSHHVAAAASQGPEEAADASARASRQSSHGRMEGSKRKANKIPASRRIRRASSFGRPGMEKRKTIANAYKAREGTGSNEICLNVDDQVTVLRRHHTLGWEGWSTVRNETTGEEGVVPTSYIVET